jgi:hypothetical protein
LYQARCGHEGNRTRESSPGEYPGTASVQYEKRYSRKAPRSPGACYTARG